MVRFLSQDGPDGETEVGSQGVTGTYTNLFPPFVHHQSHDTLTAPLNQPQDTPLRTPNYNITGVSRVPCKARILYWVLSGLETEVGSQGREL